MVGRKVIPIDIKKAKGTHQNCREKEVPPPSSEKPVAPEWLNARAKEIFAQMLDRINEIKLASATYTEILALLSCRMEEVERFDKILNESSYVYITSNSFGDQVMKPRPEVALRKEAARHVHSLLTEFGLTPAAAQKVGTPKKKQEKNDFSDF